MLMTFPFLMLDDIDDVWEEMQYSKPNLGVENAKVNIITLFY